MKVEKGIIGEYIHFFLSDADRAAVILNMDGTISQINDKFQELFVIDETFRLIELLGEDSAHLWRDFFNQAKIRGKDSFDISIKSKNGEFMQAKVQLMYCDALKKVIANFTITDLIRIEEVEATILKHFQRADSLMFIVNMEGIIVNVNKSTYEYYNLSPDYFIGNPTILMELLKINDEEAVNLTEKVHVEGFAEVLTRYERAPGDVRYYQYNCFYYEETKMYLVKVVDCTEKMTHKETISKTHQMAASIAHEIRNPMTTLKGFTQLLRGSASEESNKYLDVIDDEIIRMESILSDMIDMSKPKKIEKKLVSLGNILSDMINIVQPTATMSGISIVQERPLFPKASIYGDCAKLKQVFLNLFKNGLEAMAPGGVLTVGVEETETGKVNITVTDTGKGMTVIQLKQIFMPFFTTRADGTGIGLPFVIQTIEDHGGTISVSSEVGLGSKFTLSFPLGLSKQDFNHVPRELSQTEQST